MQKFGPLPPQLGFGGISVIFLGFWGILVIILGFEVILVIF